MRIRAEDRRAFGARRRSMSDFVDIAIPVNAVSAAESLGLKVHRSITTGATIRDVPRDEAEIVLACLKDWGFTARTLEHG
jgi:hypothetical protein